MNNGISFQSYIHVIIFFQCVCFFVNLITEKTTCVYRTFYISTFVSRNTSFCQWFIDHVNSVLKDTLLCCYLGLAL